MKTKEQILDTLPAAITIMFNTLSRAEQVELSKVHPALITKVFHSEAHNVQET